MVLKIDMKYRWIGGPYATKFKMVDENDKIIGHVSEPIFNIDEWVAYYGEKCLGVYVARNSAQIACETEHFKKYGRVYE